MFYYLTMFLAIYAGLTAILAVLGTVSKLARFAACILLSYICLVFCALYGVFASIFLQAVGKVGIAQWTVAKAFRWTLAPIIGVTFDFENEEGMTKDRPVVFVGNHQSEMDVLLLGRIFPKYCSVSAKRSLKYMPFLGWFMALSGTVFIDRANRQSALTAFDTAVNEMKQRRQSVWIFPEGTRSYSTTPTMLPFKKGAFHLAVQAQVPIVPVVIQNYSHVLNLKKLSFNSGNIKIKVLEPIPTKGIGNSKPEIDGLAEKVRKVMMDELEAMGLGNSKKAN